MLSEVSKIISTEGAGSTDSGYPYLSCFPSTHYNVYICPVVLTITTGKYLSDFNTIDNKKYL